MNIITPWVDEDEFQLNDARYDRGEDVLWKKLEEFEERMKRSYSAAIQREKERIASLQTVLDSLKQKKSLDEDKKNDEQPLDGHISQQPTGVTLFSRKLMEFNELQKAVAHIVNMQPLEIDTSPITTPEDVNTRWSSLTSGALLIVHDRIDRALQRQSQLRRQIGPLPDLLRKVGGLSLRKQGDNAVIECFGVSSAPILQVSTVTKDDTVQLNYEIVDTRARQLLEELNCTGILALMKRIILTGDSMPPLRRRTARTQYILAMELSVILTEPPQADGDISYAQDRADTLNRDSNFIHSIEDSF